VKDYAQNPIEVAKNLPVWWVLRWGMLLPVEEAGLFPREGFADKMY
jgi:hypothetical protein